MWVGITRATVETRGYERARPQLSRLGGFAGPDRGPHRPGDPTASCGHAVASAPQSELAQLVPATVRRWAAAPSPASQAQARGAPTGGPTGASRSSAPAEAR